MPRPDPEALEFATSGERAALLDAFACFALDHLDGLPEASAAGVVGPAGNRVAESVSVAIPEAPLPGGPARLVELLAEATTASLNTAGPGYLAYVPGGGLFASAVADFVACCINRYTGQSNASPALCRLEADVLRWLADAFGYGPEAWGILTSGGSLANFTAIATARHRHFGDSGDFSRAVVYVSDQVHHSVTKSLRLAGIPVRNVRCVRVDTRLRMDAVDVARQVAADRGAGLAPFLIVAAAGTTNTGAIDPLGPLAELCAREGMWLHVDAAYGGAFVLCDEGRRALAGIERADSITFDPHKGMFLPYGTGCLLVRDGEALRRVHSESADYLQDFDAMGSGSGSGSGSDAGREPPNPAAYGPELSRDFRGLRLWLPLMLHGAGAFRRALAEKLALARQAYEGLARRRDAGVPLEIVDPPQLSTVAFRLARRAGEPSAAWAARNAALLAGINARERVYLSSTSLPCRDGADGDSAFTLRVCVLSFRTHARHIDAFLEDLDGALADAALADAAREPVAHGDAPRKSG